LKKPFESFTQTIVEIERLQEVPEQDLVDPIEEGKWSIREIVAHLNAWDEQCLHNWLPDMKEGAVLEAFPEVEQFNKEQLQVREELGVKEIITAFTTDRRKLVHQLSTVDPEVRFTIGEGKREFSAESFAKMFAIHDQHHLEQIHTKLNEQ